MTDTSPEDPSCGGEAADHSGSLVETTVDGVRTSSGSRPDPERRHVDDSITGTVG